VDWVTEEDYEKSIASLFLAKKKSLSLTDISSFITMKKQKIDLAFSFDQHFQEQDFTVL